MKPNKLTRLLTLSAVLGVSVLANPGWAQMADDAILNTDPIAMNNTYEGDPINISGYQKPEPPATDHELESVRSELERQNQNINLNKQKTRKFQQLSRTTEKLADSTEQYIDEKIESQKVLVEHNRKMDAYNKQLRCLEKNDWNKEKCPNPMTGTSTLMQKPVAPKQVTQNQNTGDMYNSDFTLTPFVGLTTFQSETVNYESTVDFGLKAEANVIRRIAVGVNLSYTMMTITQEPSLYNNYFGYNPYQPYANNPYNYNQMMGRELSYKSFTGELYGKFLLLTHKRFRPYVGAGLGYSRTSLDFKDRQMDYYTTMSPSVYKEYVANNFAGSAMAGVDFYFTKMIGVNLEVKYSKIIAGASKNDVQQPSYNSMYGASEDQYYVNSLGQEIDDAHRISVSAGLNISF